MSTKAATGMEVVEIYCDNIFNLHCPSFQVVEPVVEDVEKLKLLKSEEMTRFHYYLALHDGGQYIMSHPLQQRLLL